MEHDHRRGRVSRAVRWARLVERSLDRVGVRGFLSLAIVISLLPLPGIEWFDPLFLALFATEIGLRLFVWLVPLPEPMEHLGGAVGNFEPPGRGRGRTLGNIFLILIDLVALVSFFPGIEVVGARWLRIFRLTRMLLLVGYWAPLVIDL